jgi:hypothetical protein
MSGFDTMSGMAVVWPGHQTGPMGAAPRKKLKIYDPHEKRMLGIEVNGHRLRRQGLTEIFFESAEPSFGELSSQTFFPRFSEGRYEVEGVPLDDQELESETQVTHLLPAPPANISISGVPTAENCDADDVTEVEMPAGFIALGDEFKFEILVREANGNQTAIESCFETD